MITIPQYGLDGLGGEFKDTQEVERLIASYIGAKHCVMVSNGTVALFLMLRAIGAKHVAIPALTMFGSAAAADLAGCKISFVAGNMLPEDVDTYLHVSLNGRDNGIKDVIVRYPHVRVVEDAAQSLGSTHEGRALGTFGVAGVYSFSPHKIVSAGNGGCVVTNDDGIADEVRALKNFGRVTGGADIHDKMGYNFKFSDIQARFMLPQITSLKERVETKQRIYARYYEALKDHMLPHTGTPWFVDYYVSGDRERFVTYLTEQGIGTRKMYPLLTTQRPYAAQEIFGNQRDIDEASRRATSGVWLPSSFSITDKEIDTVIDTIKTFNG